MKQMLPESCIFILAEKQQRDSDRLQKELWSQAARFDKMWDKINPLEKALKTVTVTAQPLISKDVMQSDTVDHARSTLKESQTFAAVLCLLNILENKSKKVKMPAVRDSIVKMYNSLKKATA